MKNKYIGVVGITNTMGVGIVKFDEYEDCIHVELTGCGEPITEVCDLLYDIEGNPYFEIYEMVIYLSEVMRTN